MNFIIIEVVSTKIVVISFSKREGYPFTMSLMMSSSVWYRVEVSLLPVKNNGQPKWVRWFSRLVVSEVLNVLRR